MDPSGITLQSFPEPYEQGSRWDSEDDIQHHSSISWKAKFKIHHLSSPTRSKKIILIDYQNPMSYAKS